MYKRQAENDPVKARKLLLAGYRLQEKRLALFPDRKLPMSGQYVAKIVMNNIIQALAKPENAAMVSIFVPGELLTAAGLTPYSVCLLYTSNPNLLTGFGAEGTKALWNGVFLATCIASAVGMFVMAFLANKPFALAPGMGLNSFFAVVVANIVSITGLSYVDSFQAALCIILIEGLLFFILSLFNIRDKLVDAIPYGVRLGISPAIGLMLLNIGFVSNAGVYAKDGGPFYAVSYTHLDVYKRQS